MRKTLKDIPYYPTPAEIYNLIMASSGWPYKRRDSSRFLVRDRALVALLYIGGLRISEACRRISRNQFVKKEDHVLIQGVELSKTRVRGRPRQIRFREVRMPLTGERAEFTRLVMEYVDVIPDDAQLFPFDTGRGWQIVTSILPDHTCHWLRAYCENYLYDRWDKDLLAVADYIKVDERTLRQYIRRRDEKYLPT